MWSGPSSFRWMSVRRGTTRLAGLALISALSETLGEFGVVMTPDEARKEARELLTAAGKGDNPAEDLRQYRAAPTMADVCARFMAEHVAHRCKPSTQGEYRRSLDLFILPALGPRKVGDIQRADVARLHHDMKHIPYQANRTLGVLSNLFNL